MSGREVFRDGETVGEAGLNRNFDTVTVRFLRATLHTDQLHVVIVRTTGTRLHHHEHRVTRRRSHTVREEFTHLILLDIGPGVDDSVVALLVRIEA